MKRHPRFSNPNSKPFSLEILYSKINSKVIQLIQRALATTYNDILDIVLIEELELLKEAFNTQRDQYDADILITYLLKTKKTDIALWIIHKDLYCIGMKFIFGYAIYHMGAVLSIYRLSTQKLMNKEAIHEVGHILGLQHCSNQCVMHFSNSLWEAKMKPSYLCKSCKQKIIFI